MKMVAMTAEQIARHNDTQRLCERLAAKRQAQELAECGPAYAESRRKERERAAADVLEQARMHSAEINRRPTRVK